MAMDKIKYSGYGLAVCTALFSVAAMAGTDADGKVPVPASGVSAAGRHADAAAGQEAPVPRNADEILQNLRDIVERGNLADEQYYSRKLGVVMKEGNAEWLKAPWPCERPRGLFTFSDSIKTNRALYYSSIPWFFDKAYGRKSNCGLPYSKAIVSNSLYSINAQIVINRKKICITESDVRKYFLNGSIFKNGWDYSKHKSMFKNGMQYFKNGLVRSVTSESYIERYTNNPNGFSMINMTIEPSGGKCVLSVLLFQSSRKGVN